MEIKEDELRAQITYRLVESLSTSEKRYETLVGNLQEVVFESDLKSILKFLNSTWESTLGYTIKESLGRSLYDFVFDDDKESYLKLFNFGKEQRSGNKQDTLRFLHKKGHLLWLVVSVTADGKGRVSGSLHDVTELRETTVSKDYVDNILKSVIDSLIVVDRDGKMKTINPATVELLGYAEDELIGKSMGKIIVLPTAGAAADTMFRGVGLEKLMEDGFVRDIEMNYLTKDKKEIPMSFSGAVMKDDKGGLQGIVCIAKDITERKRMEEQLQKSQEFIETVFDSIIDPIAIIDTTNFKILKVNRALLKTYDIFAKDVIGKTCYEVTHNRDEPCGPPNDTCPLVETLKAGVHSSVEHIHYNEDGGEIYVEVSAHPIRNKKGEIHRVVHIARDITQHKLVEETLIKKNKELEKFNKLAVGRELKMVELKREINALHVKLGEELQYKTIDESHESGGVNYGKT